MPSPKSPATLSVVIITYNEEINLGRCLESLRGVADEIVVLDSHSEDRTAEIAREHGVKFSQHAFDGHIEQKNRALALATQDYVLCLDADEVLSLELRETIRCEKSNGFTQTGYAFPRLTRYVTHWVKHCGWYPDAKMRLFKRGAATWSGHNPHDILIPSGADFPVARLAGDLLHYSYHSIADHVTQTNRFTTIAAQSLHVRGIRSSNFKIFTRPVLQFLRDYFLKLGILDGRFGFVICYINGLSALLKYGKLKELQDK